MPQVVRLWRHARHSRPGCNLEYVCAFLWYFLLLVHPKATSVSIPPVSASHRTSRSMGTRDFVKRCLLCFCSEL